MPAKHRSAVTLRALGACSIHTRNAVITPAAEVVFASGLFLLLERDAPVSRRQLQDLLWPGADSRAAAHRLRQTLLKLKQAGFPLADSDRSELRVAAVPIVVDYEEFLSGSDALEFAGEGESFALLAGFEPSFSAEYRDWLESRRSAIAASLVRMMLGVIAQQRMRGEWAAVERNATRLLRLAPYNEEATLAKAEACAMRGGKVEAIAILDKYLNAVGRGPTDLRIPATTMRRRIADRMPPRQQRTSAEAPFVGRGAFLEMLGGMLQGARASEGTACLVTGDAGIGKTRLLSEFSAFASLQGVVTQRVQCAPSDLQRPLSVFMDLAPQLLGMRGAIGCSPETLQYLGRLTKHKPVKLEIRADEGDSEFVYARVQQSLFDLIDAVSEETCVMILIEDVHWLDGTSATLLREMLTWAKSHRVLFAFTGRDLPEAWMRAAPGPLRRLQLDPLPPEDAQDVVLGIVRQHGRAMHRDYVQWCVRVAEGNPYFLQELANQWIETGEEHRVPPSLSAVIESRVSRLSADALQLLQTCALLGKNATLERLERVLQYQSHQLLRGLNELGTTGMLVTEVMEVGADRLGSRHELLSSAAIGRLPDAGRAFLHRRIGLVLEEDVEQEWSATLLWDCAKHWQRAGDLGRALRLARSCATHLMDVGLPAAAADAYEKALRYCRTSEETLEILEGLAQAHFRSSAWQRVSEVVAKARPLKQQVRPDASEHDDLELMNLRAEWIRWDFETSLGKALTCANCSSADPTHRVRAGGLALMLADALCNHASMTNTFALLVSVWRTSRVDDSARLRAEMVFHTCCGDLNYGAEAARALVDEVRKQGEVSELFRSLCNAALSLRTCGHFDEAEAFLREALTIADHHKLALAAWTPIETLANMALELGKEDDARHWCEIWSQHPHGSDDEAASLRMADVQVRIALLDGRPRHARKLLRKGLGELANDPLPLRKTYELALHVAASLAAATKPNKVALSLLQQAHRISRVNTRQAFAAYTLYYALSAVGREVEAQHTLGEYLHTYRREPWLPMDPLKPILLRLTS